MEFDDTEPREIELATVDTTPPPIKTGFSWAAFGGGLAAFVWLAGAIGAPLSFYGVQGLAGLNPALQAGLVALAFGPAMLFWLAASAVGEASKARKLATELTKLTREQIVPVDAAETQSKKLTFTVKNEIEMLNDAVEAALTRLNDLEAAAQRNTVLFSQALADTRENAGALMGDLSRERDAFIALNEDLKGQTETMAHAIGRQIRLMREASKLVTAEIVSAEDTLENHLAAFTTTADVMAQRTADFHRAAATAKEASGSLDDTMTVVLEGLSEATKLTDSARRSAEEATHAAATTANAVRETTQRAVFEAKKAAQMIRAETHALQDAAVETLAKLREAAEAARAASEDSQAAADRHAAAIEKRLGALASTANARRQAPAERIVERVAERKVERPAERPIERPIERVANEAFAEESLYAVAAARTARVATAAPQAQPAKTFPGFKGFSSWTNFLPSEPPSFEAANSDDAFDALDMFGAAEPDPDAQLKTDAISLVNAAGVELGQTLDAHALEQVANRSRMGAVARRRAVAEAAPVAVSRIARYVKRNSEAKVIANDFRARPDLAQAEEKGSDLVRAYLLIDAALA